MKLKYDIKACTGMRRRVLMALLVCTCFSLFNVQAQIKIKGNVYGGGNQGDVAGSTAVTVRGGDFNRVYGGARMADVGGNAFVHLDGASASSYTIINYVFGGNDISGTIKGEAETCSVPSLLTHAGDNHIDETWNTFVLVSSKLDEDGKVTSDNPAIFVGQLFGGGNGNYTYSETPNSAGKYEVRDGTTLLGTSDTQFDRPVLAKTYLEIMGGSIANVFGGGNLATVSDKDVICIDNPSAVVTSIEDIEGNDLVTNERLYEDMGLNKVTVDASGTGYQISNCFGGNNKAAMSIRPTWNLRSGSIRNLYSGGNEGDMTSSVGLLLEIPATSNIVVNNVYGGCRKADVRPQDRYGNDVASLDDIQLPVAEGYKFPAGLSARVLVRGGDIQNVYGGNDISGDVWGGTAVGVYTSIHGDVYGGGNGSYAYTDNKDLKDDLTWGDFYYDVNEILGEAADYEFSGMESATALSVFRPNAERVSVRLHSVNAEQPTIIGGSVYVGGNSATLRNDRTGDVATGELKIGSNVIAGEVFLANNGVNMVGQAEGGILARYAGNVEVGGVDYDFSTMDLTQKAIFAKYMEGCAMSIHPSIVFDNTEKGDPDTYDEYTTAFGSLYFGGNVGSMTWEGTTTLDVNHKVVIYDKVVGGCKNANVSASDYNAEFLGGILGSAAEQAEHGKEDEDGNIQDCLVINLSGIKIQPKRWKNVNDKSWGVEWNTVDGDGDAIVVWPSALGVAQQDDLERRLMGGNIYGGCYNSGHINGNVVINITEDIIEKDKVFDIVEKQSDALYGNTTYNIIKRNSGVILDEQGMDPLGGSLNLFGGGYGKDSEVWGSTTVNLISGYTFQIFGGGEHGAIGKHLPNAAGNYIFDGEYEYPYDARYSTHVNLHDATAATANNDVAETEFIYGGSYEAPIAGNTVIHLGNGRIFNSFAGSCNADIEGHTETYVGLGINTAGEEEAGFPYVRDHIYGGNDLGGRIKGETNADAQADCDFSGRVRAELLPNVYHSASTTKASAYIEYRQGRIQNIFGGAYGDYDYKSEDYRDYCNEDGSNKAGFTKPRLGNAFINFRPVSNSNPLNGVQEVYGGGQGQSRVIDRDYMQERSYLLIDIPQTITTFQNMAIFGSGSYCGLGMELDSARVAANPDMASAVIDLFRGQLTSVYGAGHNEGVTRRTVVNVPTNSTVKLTNIFGGALGTESNANPCDAYESNVNFNGTNAIVYGGIYGGNNAYRRTIYGKVNINAPLYSNDSRTYEGYAYGAGLGKDTWSHYTEVNINDGGKLYKAYGGGNEGQVINALTLKKKITEEGIDTSLGANYHDDGLINALVRTATLDGGRYNTNVRVNRGGIVTGYAYGAGRGGNSVVSGTTYGEVLGGDVQRDFYAGGEGGAVRDLYALKTFTATANLYVESGTVRNCYGGGYLGDVGYHNLESHDLEEDVLGESNVVVGRKGGTGFYDGIPAVQRNAYAGGEGGSIYGTTHLTVNNGYVGYRYVSEDEDYVEELMDGTKSIEAAGNCFGGGYILNSYVDNTYVDIYGGTIRGSVYGGGELGPVGRGQNSLDYGPDQPALDYPLIHKGGAAYVTMYGGHVLRNVFGGGRGEDSWGGDGTMYMSDAQKALSDFNAKGFVYGTTRVAVHGGEVGTEDGVADGYGNVFGGGDIGYVYSATGKKVGTDPNTLATSGDHAGLPEDGGGYYYLDGEPSKGMTLDCSVDISPYCQVTDASGITIDGESFALGDYVPIESLNKLRNKEADKAQWDKLDLTGIIIRNAVFAGGNVSAGSDKMFVNTKTIYGNAVAALRDVYHRDFITIGTEYTGGLYGDGNLTFVDGYRELHISNYGTDFYGLEDEITLEKYHSMSDRERAYFELMYQCQRACTDKNGKEHPVNEKLSAEDYNELFEGTTYHNETYWKEFGFCTLYAGRLLNTIQRADMVGVFGSRMVLQGAQDRVPEKVDYKRYTINRVGELSLNRVQSQAVGDAEDEQEHGNYFGIYNVVNYLGNLTSDVFFSEVRTTNVSLGSENVADGETSYYGWKVDRATKKNRNNGTSKNKLALASGVHLDIIREDSEKLPKTDWGYITGIVELDLIDVMQGLGGGYVYARNEHGESTYHGDWKKVILSLYNSDARTYRKFVYSTADETKLQIETSGNFVHSTKQIIDDCFPRANAYKGLDAMDAHYWYIKGSIYVYDQYISAYTGSATTYSQNVSIPLTISAASHGKLTLHEVQPNLYAYYDKNMEKLGSSDGDATFEANGTTYSLNDPINWWEWNMLSAADQGHFVPETYTVIEKCKIDGTEYEKGYAMLPAEYAALKTKEALVYNEEKDEYETNAEKNAAFLVRQSNNLGHDTGYLLTFDIDNPESWNKWYTKTDDIRQSERVGSGTYNFDAFSSQSAYTEGPTYHLNAATAGVYGQKHYDVGDIIANPIYDTYQDIVNKYSEYLPTSGQAAFEEAFVTTAEVTITDNNGFEHHLFAGVPIVQSEYPADEWDAVSSKVAEANVITSTLQLDEQHYLYAGDLITDAQKTQISVDYPGITQGILSGYVAKAYYCSAAGDYGGKVYEPGKAYRAIDAWCSMSEADRQNFTFNYDALDLLVDPAYGGAYGRKTQYDGPNDPRIYSVQTPVDYKAEYIGTEPLSYTAKDGTLVSITYGDILTRQQYESIPNERYHYSPVAITAPGDYYVVKNAFIRGDMPYTVGEVISADLYGSLNETQQSNIDVLTFTDEHAGTPEEKTDEGGNTVITYPTVTYYYCRSAYKVGENGGGEEGKGSPVTTIDVQNGVSAGTYNSETDEVPLGSVISADSYMSLVNNTIVNGQYPFNIIGEIPNETSTLYVSRESDIYDLSKEKIITVVYLYEYEESDESGAHITPVSERHVLNIHIEFKSGVPQIGQLSTPPTIIPGTTVGLKVPNVTPGAYEVLSSGWELFSSGEDAAGHKNGMSYVNNNTPMYWYQDGYWVAYYAKTYLGKTYSNAVQFSVANYHHLDDVMLDKEHHMYVDHPEVRRDPKIYIDSRECASDPAKSELDLLKDFFDLSLKERTYNKEDESIPVANSGALSGHHGVNTSQIAGCENLEFILRSDVSPKKYTTWTPIGTNEGDGDCFSGTLHGDGYTVSGIDHSLFQRLCGQVYNLGVTGPFTEAGIVNTGSGYVENCWVLSTADNVDDSVNAVFGNPTAESGVQVVNCYYPATNAYSETVSARGNARKMPLASFYNGEVAYNLNGFYLGKRYYDQTQTSGSRYGFLRVDADGQLPTTQEYAYYPADYAIYPLAASVPVRGYVEDRYYDGDFIYAGGTVPETRDQRYRENSSGAGYFPIWPDDYIYFGQKLNYGYVTGRTHQDTPARINKESSGRLTTVSADINRVYRAPAYFRSHEMGVAHYNPYAVFAQKSADGNHTAYPGMTAIDFTGSNGDLSGGYKQGWQSGHFFPPLLDHAGLEDLRNADLTKNWLVYTPAATANENDAASTTNTVVTEYLHDVAYNEVNTTYRNVGRRDETSIYGHAVVQNGSNFKAPNDHFLVDKQDFNAPIPYTFADDKRMYYQRRPDTYVDINKGWESVSLPFEAELVTTNGKGEISHFYGDSRRGHEYWLREYRDISGVDAEQKATAVFTYPAAVNGNEKEYRNTYLWDHYYSANDRDDVHHDDYQEGDINGIYYSTPHTYTGYAYLQPATPYIIGFPGSRYYEFDLSGSFDPEHTAEPVPSHVAVQTITFASNPGISIAVSDTELEQGKVTHNGYTFWPNYLEGAVPTDGFLMASDGGSYLKTTDEQTEAEKTVLPFRTYFTVPASSGIKRARQIIFSGENSSLYGEEGDMNGHDDATGRLIVRTKPGYILVTSTLTEETSVHVVTATGITLGNFRIAPGETKETQTGMPGVYIVTADSIHFNKKVIVK